MPTNKKKPNPTDVHIGARIKLRRHVVGLSQEKLADALGITFQQVQKYEKGTNRVGGSRLQSIASTLGCPVAYFFDENPAADQVHSDCSSETSLMSLLAQPDMMKMVRTFARIKDGNARKQIIGVASIVAGAVVAEHA
ncbi:helix-turn-helix transcriptional regulator [Rhizobium sp. 18065]|uniref:helix-turn-helix domain-containing protein n=1 Tax=Rhizobium sp. 18065 TaxID=2681411 RepID=UPI00135ACC33|nr:helix-turn-helix transcriptional regulator [Rhizobium sp. 18065]